jgi:hypothetical protein
MDSARRTAALPAVGFPIRTSPDQSLVSGSPKLIAATRVLHRLLSPRHPSCALSSLVTVSSRSRFPRSLQLPRRPRSSPVTRTAVNRRALPSHFVILVLLFLARMQLSKIENSWWSRSGSNRRLPACKAGALPTELRPPVVGGPG